MKIPYHVLRTLLGDCQTYQDISTQTCLWSTKGASAILLKLKRLWEVENYNKSATTMHTYPEENTAFDIYESEGA